MVGRILYLRMWRGRSSAILTLGISVRGWDGSAADVPKISAGMWIV